MHYVDTIYLVHIILSRSNITVCIFVKICKVYTCGIMFFSWPPRQKLSIISNIRVYFQELSQVLDHYKRRLYCLQCDQSVNS